MSATVLAPSRGHARGCASLVPPPTLTQPREPRWVTVELRLSSPKLIVAKDGQRTTVLLHRAAMTNGKLFQASLGSTITTN
jgi:hypothetical protein